MEKLNQVFQAASQDMYNAANAQGGASTEGGEQAGSGNPDDEVTDVDFEEVNDKK
jgi:molecular chaperone DnaK